MRNIKKLVAIVITVALLASMVVIAPATAEEMSDADIVETLGMLKGTGSGVTEDYLAQPTTRWQAARLFLRLLGLEEDADTWPGNINFIDVPMSNLNVANKAMLAYLSVNPGLGFRGYTDGTFQPMVSINAQMYYKVLLTALGYTEGLDFTWDEVFTFAASVGLSSVADVGDFNNGHVATATVEALKATKKDSEKTLLEDLIEKGEITETAAVTTGLYVVPVVDLAVEEATANSLSQVTVKFNKELDPSTVKGSNFEVEGEDTVVTLSEDGMSVTAMIDSSKIATTSQPAEYELVVSKDVKDTEGIALGTDYEVDLVVFDTAVPEVIGMEVVAPDTFEIIFSEQYDDTEGIVLFENGTVGVDTSMAASAANRVKVKSLSSLTAGNEYTVKVTGYKDHAGYTMRSFEDELTYVKDTTPITVEMTSAEQTEVIVKFSKELADTLDEDSFYHTFSIWEPSDVTTSDEQTYKLEFETHPIPEGAFNLMVLKKGGIEVKDEWGNKLGSDVVLSGTVTADKTAPTVALEKDGYTDKVDVKFSKTVGSSATDKKNYKVTDSSSKTVEISGVAVKDASKNIYTVTLDSAQSTGTYGLEVSGVKDKALNPNTMSETNISFNIKNDQSPTVAEATYVDSSSGKDIIYVTFNTAMGASALDSSNYRLSDEEDGSSSSALSKSELSFFDSNKKVQIKVEGGTLKDYLVLSQQIETTAGLTLPDFANVEELEVETATALANIVVTTKSKQQIEIKIPGSKVVSITANGIEVYIPGSVADELTPLAVVSYTYSGSDTIITGTLTHDNKLADSADVPADVQIVADKLKTDTGLYIAPGSVGTIKDGIKPTITDVVYLAMDKALIEVDEDLIVNGAVASDLVIEDEDGNMLDAYVDYEAVVDNAEGGIVVTLINDYAGYTDEINVATRSGIEYIKDLSENKLNAFSGEDVEMQ